MRMHFITSEAAEGLEESRFSADGVAIAHSTPFKSFIWQAISFKSGTNRRPMIKTTIAKTELIDWWLRTQIDVVEIID